MKKLFLSILIAALTSNIFFADEAKANYFAGIAGAASYSNGFFNPAYGQSYGVTGPAFWGGGYNLNSLNGGGWGGYPAGYGVPPFAAGLYGAGGNGGGNCGALTGGFGGFYSPFIH